MEKKHFVEPQAEMIMFGGEDIVTRSLPCSCYRDAQNSNMEITTQNCEAIVDTNYVGNTFTGTGW